TPTARFNRFLSIYYFSEKFQLSALQLRICLYLYCSFSCFSIYLTTSLSHLSFLTPPIKNIAIPMQSITVLLIESGEIQHEITSPVPAPVKKSIIDCLCL